MNAPFLWIIIPTFVSIFLLTIRNSRIRIIGYVASSAVFVLLTLIINISQIGDENLLPFEISSSLNMLGRSFVLREEDKLLVQIIFIINTLWGIAIFVFNKKSLIIPFGFVFSGFILAAVSVDPFLYSALIIEIAVILSIPLIVGKLKNKNTGIIRYLIYQTLAMPFILLAGWFLAGGEIIPVTQEQLIQASLLLGLGFVFWLAIFPFHSWVPMVFEESDPINSGYILIILQTFSFIIINKYISGFAWLRNFAVFFQAFRFLGIIMVVYGAVGYFFQKKVLKMIGYELLYSTGVILIAIGFSNTRGIGLFTSLIGSRLFAFPMLIWSTSYLGKKVDNISLINSGEIVKKEPITGTLFIYSLLSLAGMPLTIGFPPLQTMYQYLAMDYVYILILLLIGTGLKTIMVFKFIRNILKTEIRLRNLLVINRENIFLFSCLILLIIVGLFPKVALEPFINLSQSSEMLLK
jgi:NADH-quinone oxidoreductase subunit N